MNHLVHSSVPRRPEGTEGGREGGRHLLSDEDDGRKGRRRKGKEERGLPYMTSTQMGERRQKMHKIGTKT